QDLYFDSYAHHNIHATMIKDQSRTQTYREAISRASDQIKGKIVLDVGCGTGMFSMWAIQAGAKHVYAVECSAIYSKTKEIFKANGHETDITLIHGRLEDITLPVDKVDVIMSEWMGFGLLHQSMLDTVIVARDKYLKPGGLMLPDKATLWMCGIEDATYKAHALPRETKHAANTSTLEIVQCEPLVDIAPHDAICTKDCQISSFDMYTVTKEQLDFEAPFRLVVTRNDYLTAWVVFFDVGFTAMHPPL
ncbi:S-adenosyl-L-methionine-dependent methyltransferase, partial [Baffinella frigidus]